MTRLRRSIAFPVATLLVVGMPIVMILSTVLTLAVLVSTSLEERLRINTTELSKVLSAAITYDASGHLALDSKRLATNIVDFAEAQPTFWYVIGDGVQTITRGTQPSSARRVFDQVPQEIGYSEFSYRQDDRDMLGIRTVTQGGGRKTVAVGGIWLSTWETILVALIAVRSQGLVQLLCLVLIATTSIAVVVVKRSIARPVRRVVELAEQIDGLPNGRRISDDDTPIELKPMVAAFNTALTRIDTAFEAQRNFLANAAHELRTPLTKMRLKLEQVNDAELRSVLVRDTTRLASIVTTLLQLARLSGQSLAFAEMDLAAIAKAVVSDQVPMALKRGIEIELRTPGRLVPVSGSETAIRVALENLILNAVRHAAGTRLVIVEVLVPSEIRVIDHGPGIPVDERLAVLQPFVRGKRCDSEGTGLGLAIVEQIMSAHGGSVSLEETEGGGTTVCLKFAPAAMAAKCGRRPNTGSQ